MRGGVFGIGICLVLRITSASLVCAETHKLSPAQSETPEESFRTFRSSVLSLVEQVKRTLDQQKDFNTESKMKPENNKEKIAQLQEQLQTSTDSLHSKLKDVLDNMAKAKSAFATAPVRQKSDEEASVQTSLPAQPVAVLAGIVGVCTIPILIGLYFVTRKTSQDLHEQIRQELTSQTRFLQGNPQQGETSHYSIRPKSRNMGKNDHDPQQGETLQSLSRLLTEIAENIGPRLSHKIEPKIEEASTQVITQIKGPLDQIGPLIRRIDAQLQSAPASLRTELAKVIQEQFREEHERAVEKKRTVLMTRARQRLRDAQQSHPLLRIAEAVSQAYASEAEAMAPKDLELIKPYCELADCWKEVSRRVHDFPRQSEELWKEEEEALQQAIVAFERQASSLKVERAWFFALLDKGTSSGVSNEKIFTLKNELGIEDIPIQIESEFGDREDLEVYRLDGTGNRKVIHQVVRPGYRDKSTKAVLQNAKVVVRLEG